MTNRKTTRRALLMSVISLLLCVSMLVGTTFAWFTDEVTSGVNQIIAGNLDVEVYYGDPADKNSIKDIETLFNDVALWEPGVVACENLTVTNLGTLALKYGLGINFSNENNVDGYGLSQVLQIAVVPGGVDTTKTREEIVAGINNWQKLSAWYESGMLYPANNTEGKPVSDTYGVVIWWEPSAEDNNWNVNNGKTTSDGQPLHIDLGISLTAWQLEYESDSFNDQYDANIVVHTVAEAQARINAGEDVALCAANEPTGVITIPAAYTGTLTLNNVSIASVQAEKDANIVIDGVVTVKAVDSSAITANGKLNISGSGVLNAVGNGKHAYGIGGDNTTAITIDGITIDYVAGGYVGGVGSDTKYYKDAPEGGAAIGSGTNGAVITLENVTINKAIGGSKAAGIGALYHTGVTVNITGSTIGYVEGGVSAAGIGGSRISNGATTAENVTINIVDSTITAQGGAYGAGIGSGYDTYCQAPGPICTINISGESVINATGGKYAAGIGTGYHNAGLAGVIEESVTVNAVSGEKFYKDTYTQAQDIGFGVVDPAREAKDNDCSINYKGTEIGIPAVKIVVEVTPENLSGVDFTKNDVTYKFSGTFNGDVSIQSAAGLTQTYDGTNATVTGAVVLKAPGVLHSYESLSGAKSGEYTVTGFTAGSVIFQGSDTTVNLTNNKTGFLHVSGGDLAMNISGNTVDAQQTTHAIFDGTATNEYGVYLNVTDYSLKFNNNNVSNAVSHAIGINGRQAEAGGFATAGISNSITEFSGNTITVNSASKSGRAALKIWADGNYAPQADHSKLTAAAKELIALVSAGSNTISKLSDGAVNFNIYDIEVAEFDTTDK